MSGVSRNRRHTERVRERRASAQVKFCYYAVALVDVLGQSDELKKMNTLPESEAEKEEFIRSAKKTFGVIDGIRKAFVNAFHGFMAPNTRPVYQSLPPRGKEAVDRLRTVKVKTQHISDTIIAYTPIQNPSGDINVKTLYAILATTARMMQLSMSSQVAMRGAIDVGIASEWYPNEIYGPVLYDVHRLESEEADYPRVLVGKGVLEFLASMRKQVPGSDLGALFNQTTGEVCEKLLFTDTDGKVALDYLGHCIKAAMGEEESTAAIQAGLDFVVRERQRFASEHNTKLLPRYQRLENYYRSRIEVAAEPK